MLGQQLEENAYFSEMWRKFIFYTDGVQTFEPHWEQIFTARSYRMTPGLTSGEKVLVIDEPRGHMDLAIDDWPIMLDLIYERLGASVVLIHQRGRYWRCEWCQMFDGDLFWDIEEIGARTQINSNVCSFDIL